MYAVKEIYYTLQGEGMQTGRARRLLPLRRLQSLVGPRGRTAPAPSAISATPISSAPTGRAAASSPMPQASPAPCRAAWRGNSGTRPYVVLTGGEPMLQVDEALDRGAA